MGFAKYASTQVLSVERETAMSRTARRSGLATDPVQYETLQTEAGKTAHRAHFDYVRRPGYIYVRSRAISSRTNDNYDEFPAEEIKTAYRTFVGKPVFVNHHNDDHRRARGVIIDAALHEDTNPNGTPDTWAEVLMEVDAVRFPRLAEEVLKGNIARTSMGTNVEYSICTACNNKAYSPVEYCQHIPRMKGMKIRRTTGSGGQEEVLIAERCYGLGFFENSLLVEDPADPTAYVLGVEGDGLSAAASVRTIFDKVAVSKEDLTWRPNPVDVFAHEMREAMKVSHWDPHGQHKHKKCRFPTYGLSSLVPCGKDLQPGDVCPDHGPQAGDLQMAAATEAFRYDTGHKPYEHEYAGTKPHTTEEAIPAGSSITDLHNEHEEGYGLGGTDELSKSQDKADAQVTRQHRQLWKQHHPGQPFQGSVRVVEASACSQCNPGHGLHEGLLCGTHAHMTFLRTLHGQDAFFPNGFIAPNHSNDGMWATAQGEVKAPAQVDTMRAERCPVCQDDEAYDGDRCGICGYVAPPEMFQDPDLEKAQQVDLRQDQMEQVDGDGNMAVDTADVEGQSGVLTCDACGEEFGPDATEGDSATDVGPAPIDPAADPADQKAQADPDPAGDPTQQDAPAAPDDLSDLADKTDEELGVEDTEEQPDAPQDPLEAQSPVEQDAAPADDQSGVAPPVDDGTTNPAEQAADDSVAKGAVCPICGQGTIVSVQPASPDPAANPKEKSRDMPEQDPKKQPPVNPAKAARNRIVQALLGQQRVITAQQQQITALRDFVLEIGSAAGLSGHPRFAALQKSADDTNQTPETTPATTSDEARQPDATDDVNNVGATGEGANVNVTPQAVTDVASTDKVEPGQPPLSNLVDVTAPPPSNVLSAPPAGDGDKVINPVTVGTPSQTTMDPAGSTGWKSSSVEDPMERHTASLRLARLRIAAGLERGEDLALGAVIASDSSMSLDTIKALTVELSRTVSAQQAQAPTRAQAQRLVPRAAGGGRAPSLASTPEEGLDVTASGDGGLDEWAIGMDGLSGE